MSDFFIAIVPEAVNKEEATLLAEKAVGWLIDQGIVMNEQTDCTLSGLGYPPGPDASKTTVGSEDLLSVGLLINGMSVVLERTVFDNGGNGLDAICCPQCGFDNIESDWGDILQEWWSDSGNAKLKCQNCFVENSIVNFVFQPTWAFGYLGFEFWNWNELDGTFLEQFALLLGKKLKLVYCHI